METLNFIVELWGFLFVAVGLSLLINKKDVKRLLQFVENDVVLFYTGAVTFVLGVASVLSYNVWASNWGLIVTILGWALVLKGACHLLWPSMVKKMTDKVKNVEWMPYVLLALVIIGLVLVYLGFKA